MQSILLWESSHYTYFENCAFRLHYHIFAFADLSSDTVRDQEKLKDENKYLFRISSIYLNLGPKTSSHSVTSSVAFNMTLIGPFVESVECSNSENRVISIVSQI